MDFETDLQAGFAALLGQYGHSPPAGERATDTVEGFLNLQTRLVSRAPRAVHRSRELDAKALAAWNRAGLELIEGKARRGEDLAPHLSTRNRNANYDDALMNEWGIHHFHLGRMRTRSGFNSRTEALLFAVVRPDDLYLVDVLDHDRADGFANRSLIEVVHRNWPHLIAHARFADGAALEHSASNAERDALRGAGIVVLAQADDGTVYGAPGGGFVVGRQNPNGGPRLDRRSVRVRRLAMDLLRWARRTQRQCEEKLGEIRDAIARQLSQSPRQPDLHLRVTESRWQVIDEATDIIVSHGEW